MIRNACFLIFVLFYSCSSTSSIADRPYDGVGPPPGMPSEPGKCYARCLMADQYETKDLEYIEYTGNAEEENVEVEWIEEVVVERSTKWEKRKADKNCLSKNPEDCMVWCLVETPAQTIKYLTVKDTSTTSNYRIVKEEIKVITKKGGSTDWKEVVCKNDQTPAFYTSLLKALFREGYNVDPNSTILSQRSKNALVKYQKDNNLPAGQLDIETLDALGVNF